MAKIKKSGDYPKPMSFPVMVFWTGLFGGIFWGFIGWIAYYFSLTEIRPNVIIEPWINGNWKYGWQGTILALFLIGIISVGVAFLYFALLRTLNGLWFGMALGLILFLLVFLVLNPFFPGLKPFLDLNRDTFITSICLYVVYGIFIGYSINYEYQNQKAQEHEPAT